MSTIASDAGRWRRIRALGAQGDAAGRARSLEPRRRVRAAGAAAVPVRLRHLVRRHAREDRPRHRGAARRETSWFLASLSNTPLFRRPAVGRPPRVPRRAVGRRGSTASSCSRAISPSASRVATRPASRSSPTAAIPTPPASSAATCRAPGNPGNRSARLARDRTAPGQIAVVPRFWFNPELESRRFLVPGSIALIQMMIGSLLTALVVSREWERGTIEALLATPVGIVEFIIGKLVPNFLLGMCAMAVCVLAALFVFDIPLRGSLFALVRLHRRLPDGRARASASSSRPSRARSSWRARWRCSSRSCRGSISPASCSRSPACLRRLRAFAAIVPAALLRARPADDLPRWRHRLGAGPVHRHPAAHERRAVCAHRAQHQAAAGLRRLNEGLGDMIWTRLSALDRQGIARRLPRSEGAHRAGPAAAHPALPVRIRGDAGGEQRAGRRAEPGLGHGLRAADQPLRARLRLLGNPPLRAA